MEYVCLLCAHMPHSQHAALCLTVSQQALGDNCQVHMASWHCNSKVSPRIPQTCRHIIPKTLQAQLYVNPHSFMAFHGMSLMMNRQSTPEAQAYITHVTDVRRWCATNSPINKTGLELHLLGYRPKMQSACSNTTDEHQHDRQQPQALLTS
jgi:hypothetical protein